MIGENYPRAHGLVQQSRTLRQEVERAWEEILQRNPFDTHLERDASNESSIWVTSCVESSELARITQLFSQAVSNLWAALDALVVESIQNWSAQRRPLHDSHERFFPMADTAQNFEYLITEHCIEGLSGPQISLIWMVQKFGPESVGPQILNLRNSLSTLLNWSQTIENGGMLAPWITPVEPFVLPSDLINESSIEPTEPQKLEDRYCVARFSHSEEIDLGVLKFAAGSYIDLGFPDGFIPASSDDTLNDELGRVIESIIHIMAIFDHIDGSRSGSRALVAPVYFDNPEMAGSSGHAGEGVNRRGHIESMNSGGCITLMVEGESETLIRSIESASPLRKMETKGHATEEAIEAAAAMWGLPDFVMKPHLERKGNAVREISDGLLVVGDRGIIVQAKCREGIPSDQPRENAWVKKQIRKATKQISGTYRRLLDSSVQMTNGRGRNITVNGPVIDWGAVIIVDHPFSNFEEKIPRIDLSIPVVVLLRRDWEFLFRQLKSTYSVVKYLFRVSESCDFLGEESARYFQLALSDADANYSPDGLEVRPGERVQSGPELPLEEASSDSGSHGMVRIICEDIALSPSGGVPEGERLKILSMIDGIPVFHRGHLGSYLMKAFEQAGNSGDESTRWQFRTFRSLDGGAQVAFGICSKLNSDSMEAFRQWLILRHYERRDFEDLEFATSVGVMLTRHDGQTREWDTTMMAITGAIDLAPTELKRMQSLWPRNPESDI